MCYLTTLSSTSRRWWVEWRHIENWWKDGQKKKWRTQRTPIFQCPFGHHKSHKNWTQTPAITRRRLAIWAMAGPSRFRLHVYTGCKADAAYKRNGSKGPFFERKAAEAWKRQCVNPALTYGTKCVELYLQFFLMTWYLGVRINKPLFYLQAPVISIQIMMWERNKNMKRRNKLPSLIIINWRYEIRINTLKYREVVTPLNLFLTRPLCARKGAVWA